MAAYAPLAGLPQVAQGQEQLNQNALAEYARAAQEKQQTALLAQQTLGAQQQNQATQAVNQAYQGAFKKDANGNMTLDTEGLQQALAANGHGAAIPAVIKGITDYQTSKAQLQEQQQKLQTGTQDALGNLGYALQQANYDPQLAHTIIQDHLNDPGLDPQHRQQLLQEQQQISQNPALIKSLADQWVAQSPAQQAKTIERQKAAADTTKAEASQTEAKTKQQEADERNWQIEPTLGLRINKITGEQQPIAGSIMSPQMMEAKYVQIGALKAKLESQGQQLQPDDANFMKSYEHMKSISQIANFNLQNAGAAADAGGNPSQIAQAIANGQMSWKDAVSPRTAMATKNAILKEVFKLNPQFDTSQFGLEADAAKKARSGAWADTRLAYNTAIDHADQLLSASDALKNGDVQKLNQLKNYFSAQFGSPDISTAQAIANAYNHEVTSVVAKGHMTDAEIAQGHGVLDVTKASPDQIKGVAQAYKNLMTSKRDELDKIIKAGAGSKANAVTNVQAGQDAGGTSSDFFSQFGGKARNP
jgi:hypothetical protein